MDYQATFSKIKTTLSSLSVTAWEIIIAVVVALIGIIKINQSLNNKKSTSNTIKSNTEQSPNSVKEQTIETINVCDKVINHLQDDIKKNDVEESNIKEKLNETIITTGNDINNRIDQPDNIVNQVTDFNGNWDKLK